MDTCRNNEATPLPLTNHDVVTAGYGDMHGYVNNECSHGSRLQKGSNLLPCDCSSAGSRESQQVRDARRRCKEERREEKRREEKGEVGVGIKSKLKSRIYTTTTAAYVEFKMIIHPYFP